MSEKALHEKPGINIFLSAFVHQLSYVNILIGSDHYIFVFPYDGRAGNSRLGAKAGSINVTPVLIS